MGGAVGGQGGQGSASAVGRRSAVWSFVCDVKVYDYVYVYDYL